MLSFDWTADYQPKSFSRDEFVLPEAHRKIFEEYTQGKRTQHLLLTGDCGTGKTTAGQLLGKKSQSDHFIRCGDYKSEKFWTENGSCWKQLFLQNLSTHLFTASERETRPIKRFALLDEVDEIKIKSMIRGVLDKAKEHQIILCMTSNFPEQIDKAIHSRCLRIHFGSGDPVWDNYETDNPPGNRDDIESQLIDLVVRISKKEAPQTLWDELTVRYLRDKIIRKAKNIDIREILTTVHAHVHNGKFEPLDNFLKSK